MLKTPVDFPREKVAFWFMKNDTVERSFFYMPLQHSEDIKIQEKSVELYTALLEDVHKIMKGPFREFLKYAKMYLDVIKQFGRFPQRNTILNRRSTPEEEAFLKKPGSSF